MLQQNSEGNLFVGPGSNESLRPGAFEVSPECGLVKDASPRPTCWSPFAKLTPGVPARSPSSANYCPFCCGEGSPTKIDILKKVGTLILTSLLEDLAYRL